MRSLLAVICGAASCSACSSWVTAQGSFVVSGRALDLCPEDLTYGGRNGIGLVVVPRNSTGPLGGRTKYGQVGIAFLNSTENGHLDVSRIASMNEWGLSCDEQHLNGSTWQKPLPPGAKNKNLNIHHFCEWVAGEFKSVVDAKQAMDQAASTLHIVADQGSTNHHYVLRDASGVSLILEAVNGKIHFFDDHNDDGKTGFGVLTNEPNFEAQKSAASKILKNVSAGPAPGGWTSAERFQRLVLVKSAMPPVETTSSAVAQGFKILNTVSTPQGKQRGQDWSRESTVLGIVRDHKDISMYWRTQDNQAVQGVRLADLRLAEVDSITCMSLVGQAAPLDSRCLSLNPSPLPWFNNATTWINHQPLIGAILKKLQVAGEKYF